MTGPHGPCSCRVGIKGCGFPSWLFQKFALPPPPLYKKIFNTLSSAAERKQRLEFARAERERLAAEAREQEERELLDIEEEERREEAEKARIAEEARQAAWRQAELDRLLRKREERLQEEDERLRKEEEEKMALARRKLYVMQSVNTLDVLREEAEATGNARAGSSKGKGTAAGDRWSGRAGTARPVIWSVFGLGKF